MVTYEDCLALADLTPDEVDQLAVVDGAGRLVGVLARDGEDDPMRRLVPAFHSAC